MYGDQQCVCVQVCVYMYMYVCVRVCKCVCVHVCVVISSMFSVTLLTCYPYRVASFSEANKMPLESLAKIFGPTLVGHASAKPDPSVQWKDAEKQPKVCIIYRLLRVLWYIVHY